MALDRARTYIVDIRAEFVAFEERRLRLLGMMQRYMRAGGNAITDAYLDASGGGQTPELVDMTKLEWQAFQSTIRLLVGDIVYPATTPANFTDAQIATLSKALVPKS